MSHWKKAPFGNPAELRATWPIKQDVFDPWAGDELSNAQNDTAYLSALHSRQHQQEYLRKAQQDGLKITPFFDRSIIHKAAAILSDAQLAAIAEDWVPDLGIFAEERVLGPFAPQPRLRTLCGAVLSFSPLLEHSFTPIGQYGSLKSRKKGLHRLGVQAKTPAMLWKINADQSVSALLPVEERYKPKGPIEIKYQTPFVIAKITNTESGYKLNAALPLTHVSKDYVFNRVRLEWVRLQYHNRYIYWEDMLRFRSELLYRSCLEYCFINHKKETQQCLDIFF